MSENTCPVWDGPDRLEAGRRFPYPLQRPGLAYRGDTAIAEHHQKLPPGLTPRLLTAEQAAAYCNVGRDNFEARVGVPPLRVFGNRTLYDIRALDRWLDQQSGIAADEAEDRRVDWEAVLK